MTCRCKMDNEENVASITRPSNVVTAAVCSGPFVYSICKVAQNAVDVIHT